MKDADARALLRDLFDAALAAARPATCLAPYIEKLQPPKGRTIVIGAGKASAAMAKAVEDQWPHPLGGPVVTRSGSGDACVAGREGRCLGGRHPRAGQGPLARRSRALPDLGRRVGAAGAARARPD